MIMRYKTDTDLRKALEERLRQRAEEEGEPLLRLRKRVVFERCMVRLQKDENSPWVLKGGFALELRMGNRARMTKDVDLTIDMGFFDNRPASLSELTEKLRVDLQSVDEDRFVFIIPEGREEELPAQGVKSYRFSVETRLDGRIFETIRVDVGVGDPLIQPLDELPGSNILSFADIARPRIRATSPAQHLAEKVHALTRPYDDRINTRVKNLGDIMLLMDKNLPQQETVKNAVEEIFSSRQSHAIPRHIETPPGTWASSYSVMATELNLTQTTIESATSRLNDYWKTLF